MITTTNGWREYSEQEGIELLNAHNPEQPGKLRIFFDKKLGRSTFLYLYYKGEKFAKLPATDKMVDACTCNDFFCNAKNK